MDVLIFLRLLCRVVKAVINILLNYRPVYRV